MDHAERHEPPNNPIDERAALEDRLDCQRDIAAQMWRADAGATGPGVGGTNDLTSYQASVARSRAAVAGRSLDEASPGEDYTLRTTR